MSYTLDIVLKDIKPSWMEFFNKPDINDLLLNTLKKINQDEADGITIYPTPNLVFHALKYFDVLETKAVLIGQDPYIFYEYVNGVKIPQATGLSFSIPSCIKKIPPSLVNIFKELKNSIPEFEDPINGDLTVWTKEEKILLLNSYLTVQEKKSNSHKQYWDEFSDYLIKFIQDKCQSTVFILLGLEAFKKVGFWPANRGTSPKELKPKIVDDKKHKIFYAGHPSPANTRGDFNGSNVFKQVNDYFDSKSQLHINWHLVNRDNHKPIIKKQQNQSNNQGIFAMINKIPQSPKKIATKSKKVAKVIKETNNDE